MGVVVRQKNKARGAPWWVFINHQGKRKSLKVGDKAAAERVASKIREGMKTGRVGMDVGRPTPTFEELAEQWIQVTVPATCKASSLRGYKIILDKHILPVFGIKPVDQITRLEIKDYLLSKVAEGCAASSVNHFKNALSGVLNRAVEAGTIPANPAHRLGKIVRHKERKADVKVLTQDELSKLLLVVKEKYAHCFPMVLCLARTGMRIGEAIGLEWDDIDFNGQFIEIKRCVVRGKVETPKSGKSRRVDMSKQLGATLSALKTERERQALAKGWGSVPPRVFLTPDGYPMDKHNFRNRVWDKALKAAGLGRMRIHDLRHTFASLLIQQGESLAYVRGRLGRHGTTLTVDTYGHLAPGGNRAANAKPDHAALCPRRGAPRSKMKRT